MSPSAPLGRKIQWLFLGLTIVGCVLPLSHFVRFLLVHGANASLFFSQLFQTEVSTFFAMDVFISAVALWIFVYIEGRRLGMKSLWIYVLCTMLVGVSFALPLFLFMRARTNLRSREGWLAPASTGISTQH